MMMHSMRSAARVLKGLAAGLVLAAAPACTTEDTSAAFLYEKADPYRGGALWDKWWKVPEVKEGIEPGATVQKGDQTVASSVVATNPLYATNPEGNKRSGPDTWRCKECHGWDYKGKDGAYGAGSHKTGFPGVWGARGKSVTDLFEAIRDGTGVAAGAHSFAALLSDADVADLVKFIREGTIDDELVVGPDKKPKGTATDGTALFNASCATCHGQDGKKLNFVAGEYASEYVFNLAHDNPWEFTHKVRFGQPDGAMPNGGVKGYLVKDVAAILAYAQSLAPPGLEKASGARGGVLWDAWWEVNGAAAPTATNPLYLDAAYNKLGGAQSGKATWRCKECHGWDYKGAAGAYKTGSHKTGIKGVLEAAALSASALADVIGNGKLRDGTIQVGHTFLKTGLLTAADVADLALFIKEELVDDAEFISYETKRSKGSRVAGEALFNANCATCHGRDGMRVNFARGEANATEYVGGIARDNPYELSHKIRFGQPGSDEGAEELEDLLGIVTGHMPNKFDAGYSELSVANIVAYAQSLPDTVERGGTAWDTWWEIEGAAEPIEPGKTTSSLPATNQSYPASVNPKHRSGSQTWRCKECHGWDYLGKDGAYGSGSHYTNIKGVFDVRGAAAGDLRKAIAGGDFDGNGSTDDARHAFGAVLGENVVRDLVHFVQATLDVDREVVDPATKGVRVTFVAYDAASEPGGMKARTRDASLVLGELKFEANCARCHGNDGRAINFGEGAGEVEYVGDIAKDNPWELLHKVRHGQPGSDPRMPSAAAEGYSVDDLAELLYYARQLP